jgi:AraC-like DNA-binding protein
MRPLFSVHAPPAPLAGPVGYFWSLADAPSHSRERVIPSGTVEIVFNLYEDAFRIQRPGTGEEPTRFGGAIVSGPYGRAFGVETRAHASIVGVHLEPGGAASILGVPAGELTDRHVELEDLWGRSARELRERLCAAKNARQRFRILEGALLGRLSPRSRMRGEVAFALGRLGVPGVEVGAVARQVRLSHRRFIQIFTERVGMTPKRYARVRRFQRALDRLNAAVPPGWAQVALECGYFDQAHLCRDWTDLTGLSPAEFVRLRSVPVKDNHVALPDPDAPG